MVSRLESIDLEQGVVPGGLPRPAGGHGQARAVVGAAQLGGHEQDLVAQALQRSVLQVRRQAEPLEPIHQIVGEQKEMEIGLVGEEVAGGDAAQGVVPFELLDGLGRRR